MVQKPTRQPRQLSAREELFVREYLKDENATRAATAAGYSPRTAYAQGHRLLKRAEVAKALDTARAAQLERVELSADRVLRELMRIGFSDLGDAFDEDGNLLPVRKMPQEFRRAVAGVDVVELPGDDGALLKKVRLNDKVKALELLGKHLKLFVEVKEHKLEESLEQLVLKSLGVAGDGKGDPA